ncbi:MAG: HlyD family efflux transporter periplasmic adaptor subunit [Crocinitomicaceae bacterium]|nr:HlyD family efflux transporter periplasmic adaptor subunit [Crocinitomicaceae bacterium]
MKKLKYSIAIGLILSLSACNKEEKADAYGNFEEDATVVSAEGNGKILFFNAVEGQQIQKGDKIALLDTMQLHLQKEIVQAKMSVIASKANSVEKQIAVIQEQIDALKVTQDRLHKLYDEGAATKAQVDEVDSKEKILKEQIQAIKVQSKSVLDEKVGYVAQIKQINDLISRSVVYSPISGVVLETYVKEGEVTGAGRPMLRIQNLEELTLRAYITETKLTSVKIDQKVQVLVDAGEEKESFEGTVTWISDKAEFTPKQIQTEDERKNLTYAIKIKVPNKEGKLKIGMPASVEFE